MASLESTQYIDQYIRRKKGTVFLGQAAGDRLTQAIRNAGSAGHNTTATATASRGVNRPSSSPPTAILDDHSGTATGGPQPPLINLDQTFPVIAQVQSFVDRTDALNLQIISLEDKIINQTRMLKMLQQHFEEREEANKRDIGDLRAHVLRLEDSHAAMRETLSSGSQLQMARSIVNEEILRFKTEQEQAWIGRKALLVTKSELEQAVSKSCESMEQHIRVSLAHQVDGAAFTEKQELFIERAINQHAGSFKETLIRDIQSQCQKLEQSSVESARRIETFEQQTRSIEGALSDFINAFKEHSRQHAAKTEDTAVAIRELNAMQEESRKVIASEIEQTRQWAVRNLQRIKRHLDNDHADIAALREAHTAHTEQLGTLQRNQSREHERLCSLLEEKSKEANTLSDLIDKEIHGIRKITEEHNSNAGKILAAAAATRSKAEERPVGAARSNQARAGGGGAAQDLQELLASRSKARNDRLQAMMASIGRGGGGGVARSQGLSGRRGGTVDDDDGELSIEEDDEAEHE